MPLFTKFPTSVTVQEDEVAKFECELDSEPLQLDWLKDGKQVDEKSSRFTFTKTDLKCFAFTIKKCTLEVFGYYQAKAIGKKASTLASYSVNVFSNKN